MIEAHVVERRQVSCDGLKMCVAFDQVLLSVLSTLFQLKDFVAFLGCCRWRER